MIVPRQLDEERIPVGADEWRSVTVAYLSELYAEIAARRGELEACRGVLAKLGYDWDVSRLTIDVDEEQRRRRRRRGIPPWARWRR